MSGVRYTYLLVGPDYAAFPVWDRTPRHFWGMVRAANLGISRALAEALDAWNGEWEDDTEAAPMAAVEWEARGRELTEELQRELGPTVKVGFYLDGMDVPKIDTQGFIEDHRTDPL